MKRYTDETLARFIRKEKEKVQINTIRKEKRAVTKNITEIQRTIRDYYKQLHTNKTDYLEETDKFLKGYTLPRLNQEKIGNMS